MALSKYHSLYAPWLLEGQRSLLTFQGCQCHPTSFRGVRGLIWHSGCLKGLVVGLTLEHVCGFIFPYFPSIELVTAAYSKLEEAFRISSSARLVCVCVCVCVAATPHILGAWPLAVWHM